MTTQEHMRAPWVDYGWLGLPPLLIAGGNLTTVWLVLVLLIVTPWRHAQRTAWWRDRTALLLPSVWIGVLTGWAMLSAFWSLDAGRSANYAIKVGVLLLLGLAAYHGARRLPPMKGRLVRWLGGILLGVFLVIATEWWPGGGVLHAIVQLSGGDAVVYLHKSINRSIAILVVLMWPIVGALWAQQRRLALAILLAAGMAVAVLQSLSAQLALGCGLLVYFGVLAAPRLGKQLLRLALPLGILASVALTWGLAQSDWFITQQTALRGISAGRTLIWDGLVAQMSGANWVGSGMKTAGKLSLPAETMQALGLSQTPLHPHHMGLEVWLELGLIGLLLWILALLSLLKRAAAQPHLLTASAGFWAMLGAFLCSGFFAYSLWQSWWLAGGFLVLLLWQRLHGASARKASNYPAST